MPQMCVAMRNYLQLRTTDEDEVIVVLNIQDPS